MALSEKAKEARRAYQRKYREKNKERLNAQQREWRKDNPDKVQKYVNNYYEKLASRYEQEGADEHERA